LAVGWPPDELQTLMSVVKAESRCQSWQHNVSDPNTGSYGLMQINGWWCLPSRYYPRGYLQQAGILSTCNDLFDPATNLKAGLTVLAESTWHAWATFDG
jgi:soluble lytic murein transglycosylase-like protein